MKRFLSIAPMIVAAASENEHDIQRAKEIARVNSLEGVLWKAGVNERFRGQPREAVKPLCGVHSTSLDAMEQAIADGRAVRHTYSGIELPVSFDSEANWPECAKSIGDIRDQSNCGCCWAFAAASAASDRLCIATKGKMLMPLSDQNLCFCASSDGCNGGDLFTPWYYISDSGLVTGGQYNGTGPFGSGYCKEFSMPHCHHHGPQGSDPYPAEGKPGCPSQSSATCPTQCDLSAKAPHNNFDKDKYGFTGLVSTYPDVGSIKEAIMTQGPVEAAFIVYADFANYVSGIYHKTSDEVEGGHAIRIVGWGEEKGVAYWKVANSWNPYWGENGYFRIRLGTNECDIEKQVTANMADAVWKKM